MSCPLPPGTNRKSVAISVTGVTSQTQTVGPSNGTPSPSKPPSTKVTQDETSFILKSTLIPEHAEDPNILKFISSYLICRNVRQAARETGITYRDGENLKRRPDIHEAIRAITEKAVVKYGYDASEVVERVKEIVNVDLADFENPDGSYKERLSELSPELRRAVKKFKVRNIYETDPNGMKVVVGKLMEVELWDKMKAAELLGREKDIFKEKKVVEHDVGANMRDMLLESRKRAEEFGVMRDVGPRVELPEPIITKDE